MSNLKPGKLEVGMELIVNGGPEKGNIIKILNIEYNSYIYKILKAAKEGCFHESGDTDRFYEGSEFQEGLTLYKEYLKKKKLDNEIKTWLT